MTIIEVLFSIGVVMIGLLGVAALLPVAGYQAAKGLTADRAAAAGRAAVEQFKVRGMGRQVIHVNRLSKGLDGEWGVAGVDDDNNGVRDDSTEAGWPGSDDQAQMPVRRSMWLVAKRPPAPPNEDFLSYKQNLSGSQAAKEALAVCIDPRFVAANRANTPANSPYDERQFPYYEKRVVGEPRMRRITLRAVDPRVNIARTPMRRLQAEQIFTWSDDLEFELPEDRTLPPMQVYGSPGPDQLWGTPDDQVTRRQYAGAVSWLATIAPKFDQQGAFRDLYVLSIVVFNHRDASMAMNGINERIADVHFWGGGVGGGDVTLGAPAPTQFNGTLSTESDLELQDGDWIMLAANMSPVPNAPNTPIPVFRWYRVLSTDSEAANVGPNQWTRNATLLGPDWDRSEWLPPSNNPNGAAARSTVATLVTGVVSVYEKTIRLETTSLWTN